MQLNQQQQAAVDSDSPLITLIAGAGSGKTATLVERVCRDIEHGTRPEDIGIFTFTQAAAKEFTERLEQRVTGARFGYIGTLHGFCLRLAIYRGCVNDILDEKAYWQMVDEQATRLRIRGSMLDYIKAQLRKRSRDTGKKGEILIRSVEREMRQRNVIHLDGLVPMGAGLLAVMKQQGDLRGIPKAIYVDEYQDTSLEDHECYMTMDAERQFYVGDPDQAIMGFRGGDHTLLEGLAKRAERTGGLHYLETNYRCSRDICHKADKIITQIHDRMPKRTDPRPDAPAGIVTQIDGYHNHSGEVANTAKHIAELLQRGVPEREIAVLVRYNKQAAVIAEALRSGHDMRVTIAGQDIGSQRRVINEAVRRLNDNIDIPEMQAARMDTGWDLELALRLLAVPEPAAAEIARNSTHSHRSWFPTPEARTELLQAAREWMEGSSDENSITISTVHKAKGREWDHVFLPHCDSVGWRQTDTERRLAYVGATRARKELVITAAQRNGEKQAGLSGIFA